MPGALIRGHLLELLVANTDVAAKVALNSSEYDSSVDLPAPFVPIIPVSCPGSAVREILFRASCVPR